jgi:hypothetical protein
MLVLSDRVLVLFICVFRFFLQGLMEWFLEAEFVCFIFLLFFVFVQVGSGVENVDVGAGVWGEEDSEMVEVSGRAGRVEEQDYGLDELLEDLECGMGDSKVSGFVFRFLWLCFEMADCCMKCCIDE